MLDGHGVCDKAVKQFSYRASGIRVGDGRSGLRFGIALEQLGKSPESAMPLPQQNL